ncbi:uncharacterized protein LOC130014242 isoform X3 [Patella vulgata]|uniref:uncharacterized protein LOC130014242 isoform X3 n=1 Tax=Patella vulgata TaxID=6465 RepID=UPI0024A925E8|nr:uncharacterized protein LOC130014242 isoform X3 [Patella vulgata]
MSLLHFSCLNGIIETVEYLVNIIGLDVHHKDNEGWTSAMYCSRSKISPVSKLKLLSSKGVNLHTVDNDKGGLLHASCQDGTIETVKYLVNDIGLDVHCRDTNGRTPAKHCSMSDINPVSKLRFLSSQGVSLHTVDDNNRSLLHVSCRFGNIETVEYLVNDIELGMHHRGNNGWTPVMSCCISTKSPVSKLKFLSTKGASLHINNDNTGLLYFTCRYGITETLKFLVNEIGLYINQRSEGIYTLLLLCFKSNVQQMEKINFLISKGAKIIICRPYQDDMTDEGDYGKCCYPLHHSCYLGTLDTVKWLVNDAGYDVNYTDDDNMIALLWSFKTKIQQQEKIKFLISKGAKIIICRPYQDGMTDEGDYGKCCYPLHHSCYLGTLDTVKWLVNDAGYDVNYTDDDNMTALFWSFKTKIQQKEKMKFLIFKGDFFNNIL